MMHVARCTLHVARCTLHVARCTLHVARCTLHVARCTLHVARCMQGSRGSCCMLAAANITFQLVCTDHVRHYRCRIREADAIGWTNQSAALLAVPLVDESGVDVDASLRVGMTR